MKKMAKYHWITKVAIALMLPIVLWTLIDVVRRSENEFELFAGLALLTAAVIVHIINFRYEGSPYRNLAAWFRKHIGKRG